MAVPRKVFGTGLGKTGTTSLARALRGLGYRTCHFPFTHHLARHYDALVDNPTGLWFRELDRRFPGSRFIHTTRPLETWLESCEHWFSGIPIAYGPQRLYTRYLVFRRWRYDRARFTDVFLAHEEAVSAYFRDRPGDLLRLNLFEQSDDEVWAALLGFLQPPFPKKNSRRKP